MPSMERLQLSRLQESMNWCKVAKIWLMTSEMDSARIWLQEWPSSGFPWAAFQWEVPLKESNFHNTSSGKLPRKQNLRHQNIQDHRLCWFSEIFGEILVCYVEQGERLSKAVSLLFHKNEWDGQKTESQSLEFRPRMGLGNFLGSPQRGPLLDVTRSQVPSRRVLWGGLLGKFPEPTQNQSLRDVLRPCT